MWWAKSAPDLNRVEVSAKIVPPAPPPAPVPTALIGKVGSFHPMGLSLSRVKKHFQ